MKRVLIVGSARESGGGISSVIRLMEKMPVWKEYDCYWLGTQIQRNYLWKMWYAIKAYFISVFIIWRYDIVHFHTVQDWISLFIQLPILLLARLGRKKILIHLHIGDQLQYCQNNIFLKWWMIRGDGVILLSKKFQSLFGSIFPDIDTPTHIIYNPCDNIKAIPYSQHKKTILFACEFTKNKSGEQLIEAFAKVHNKFPEWKLQLVGRGENEKIYKALIRKFKIENKVEMKGYLRGENLKEVFKQAGIYCLCSHHEGFPMVVLEAWSYGIPVITTPVGGLTDIIDEGTNALIYNYGKIEELSHQLTTLISDEILRSKMSENSIMCVKKNFSLDVINKSIEELYNKYLEYDK